MKFLISILLIILSSCSTSKSGLFSCSCVNIDDKLGVKQIEFVYSKGAYEGESSEINAYFKIDPNEKDCYKFILYFDKMNDTLQMVGFKEGYQKFTTEHLQEYLESGKKLKLRIVNKCQSLEEEYNVKCVELEENKTIRGH